MKESQTDRKPAHGGKRTGAGRPKKRRGSFRPVTLNLSQVILRKLARFCRLRKSESGRKVSRSEAVETLLRNHQDLE